MIAVRGDTITNTMKYETSDIITDTIYTKKLKIILNSTIYGMRKA